MQPRENSSDRAGLLPSQAAAGNGCSNILFRRIGKQPKRWKPSAQARVRRFVQRFIRLQTAQDEQQLVHGIFFVPVCVVTVSLR
jgi:hypothetical protein